MTKLEQPFNFQLTTQPINLRKPPPKQRLAASSQAFMDISSGRGEPYIRHLTSACLERGAAGISPSESQCLQKLAIDRIIKNETLKSKVQNYTSRLPTTQETGVGATFDSGSNLKQSKFSMYGPPQNNLKKVTTHSSIKNFRTARENSTGNNNQNFRSVLVSLADK